MKIPVIKKIIQEYSLEELQAAEEALLEERQPAITIEGEDEGEQLTHAMAAIWIKQDMEANGTDLKTSLRSYTLKVRDSIS